MFRLRVVGRRTTVPVSVGDCLHVSNVRLSHISNVCLVQLPLLHVLIYCSLVQIFDFLDSCVLTCLTRLQRLASLHEAIKQEQASASSRFTLAHATRLVWGHVKCVYLSGK